MPPGASAATGQGERFSVLANAEPGIIHISAPGYATKRMRWPLPQQLDSTEVEVRLEPTARLQIEVRNSVTQASAPAVIAVQVQHPGDVTHRTLLSTCCRPSLNL